MQHTNQSQPLHELIDNGLKLGSLIMYEKSVFQYTGQGLFFVGGDDLSGWWSKSSDRPFATEENLQNSFTLTTAYDADIAPEDLRFPEPIDSTGWVIASDGVRFKPISFTATKAGDIERRKVFYWENCLPCLPPAIKQE